MFKPYIAASSYLNAAPLCYSFIKGNQKERCRFLFDEAPARCADLLAEGRAAAALIPVIEYQRIAGLRVAAGVCVASLKSVRSVILVSRVPIEEVATVALDTSSRTSAALVRIILRKFYHLEPDYRPSPPRLDAMLGANDAALLIGDPAMLIRREGVKVYDLAEEWRRHTGLPFVFAFWGVRSEFDSRASGVSFADAKREGLEHLDEIADLYSMNLDLPRAELAGYLTENISYDLDGECLRGLDLYYELARDCGLIEVVRPLVFME